MVKQWLIILAALVFPGAALAAGGYPVYPDDEIKVDWDDRAAMQRGARTYMNYCMGCHSLHYSRYNRVGADLGISDDMMRDNLIFTTDISGERTKVGELMTNNMSAAYGEEAFGVAPPDLSLVARSRGTHWLYNFLRGFYVDEERPFGVNNGVFSNVGMPHVLAELQGLQAATYETVTDSAGNQSQKIVGFEQVRAGTMAADEYDRTIYDLVAFLDYVAEPYKQTRKNVGTGVIIFLLCFLVLAYALKREYWKDVH